MAYGARALRSRRPHNSRQGHVCLQRLGKPTTGRRGSGTQLVSHMEVCVMQKAAHILQAMQKLGEKGIPLTRVYRNLYNEDFFLKAYDKVGRNEGSMTPGVDDDIADGTSLKRIRRLIEQLRCERYHFRPVRRTHIPKKKGGKRPLGMPNFSENCFRKLSGSC